MEAHGRPWPVEAPGGLPLPCACGFAFARFGGIAPLPREAPELLEPVAQELAVRADQLPREGPQLPQEPADAAALHEHAVDRRREVGRPPQRAVPAELPVGWNLPRRSHVKPPRSTQLLRPPQTSHLPFSSARIHQCRAEVARAFGGSGATKMLSEQLSIDMKMSHLARN